jgi:hypothetical protein
MTDMTENSKMTSLILDFPEDVMLKICTNWISLRALCRLDSAICVKNKRDHFLQVVGASYASITNTPPASPCAKDSAAHNITTKSLKWLTKRQLSVEHLTLSKDVDGLVVEECLPRSPKLLKNVKTLAITAGPKVAKSTLLSVSQGCTDLRSFSLNGFKNLNDLEVSAIVLRSPDLRTLNLAGCWTVSDADIARIAKACTKLETVDLSACFALTDAALVSLAEHCPLLQSVNLQHCGEVTDAGVTALAKGCRQLRHINLSTCVHLTDEGINSLALHSPALHSADLSYLKAITDSSVGHVATRCAALRELQLEGCTGISNASLEKISKFCARLQSLNVKYCMKVTADVAAELKQKSPDLVLHSTAMH